MSTIDDDIPDVVPVILTNKEVKSINEANEVKIDKKELDRNLTSLIDNFNKERIKENNDALTSAAGVIKIMYMYDMFKIKEAAMAMDKFDIELNKVGYSIKKVKKNNWLDSCPDPTLALDIIIVPNNYQPEYSIFKKFMLKFGIISEY